MFLYPEPRVDIEAQLANMISMGHKNTMYISEGSHVPDVSEHEKLLVVKHGASTLITRNFNKAKAFKNAMTLTDDFMKLLLDYTESKSTALLDANSMVVQARTETGAVVQETLVSPGNLEHTASVYKKYTGLVVIVSVLEALARRAKLLSLEAPHAAL